MKILIRILALALCTVMLLSAGALAAGKEISLENVAIVIDGTQKLDLSGVGLNLGFVSDADGAGMHIGLSAGDESVLDIQACLRGDVLQIAADGVKDVYSMNLADLATAMQTQMPAGGFAYSASDRTAAMALVEQAKEVLAQSVTPDGEVELDGIVYSVYNVSVSAEQVQGLLDGLAVLLNDHPELFMDSEYDNFSAVLADMDAVISLEGLILEAEDEFVAELYPILTDVDDGESETLLIYVEGNTEPGEAAGTTVQTLVTILGELEDDGSIDQQAAIALNYLEKAGEFGMLEVQISDIESTEGVYLGVSAPELNEDAKWHGIFQSLSGEFALSVEGNDHDGGVLLESEGEYISLAYIIEGEKAQYGLSMLMDGSTVEIVADGSITDSEGEWMIPADAQTVDLSTMDEAKINALSMEFMSVTMNALARLSQANQVIAALISGAMG